MKMLYSQHVVDILFRNKFNLIKHRLPFKKIFREGGSRLLFVLPVDAYVRTLSIDV